jgi:hypothetical protein
MVDEVLSHLVGCSSLSQVSYSSIRTAVPLAPTMSIPPPFCCPNVS